ncbi:hypothetical protein FRC17_009991 [Serendipita sp. 399]|nr:hypothetical protein FRC17_009991 [Serendipita sp. 399]
MAQVVDRPLPFTPPSLPLMATSESKASRAFNPPVYLAYAPVEPQLSYSSQPLSSGHDSMMKGDLEGQSPERSLRDEKIHEDEQGVQTRKWSIRWWKTTWSDIRKAKTWPRVVYCALGILFFGVWISVSAVRERSLTYLSPKEHANAKAWRRDGPQGLQHQNQTGVTNGSFSELIPLKVLLQGSLVNFNIEKRALTITWSGLYLYDFNKDPVVLGDKFDDRSFWFPMGIEIFRDIDSGIETALYFDPVSNQNTSILTYRTDNETAKPIGVIGVHVWDRFDTDIAFTQRYQENAWFQPLLGYPLDQWEGIITLYSYIPHALSYSALGKIIFVANDREISDLLYPSNSAVIGLSGVVLVDSTLNWRFTVQTENKCDLSNDDLPMPDSCHLVSGKKYLVLSFHAYKTLKEVTFIGKRPPLLIFCAIAAVVVNWTCAVFIFILTCEAIVMRRSYMLQGTDILSMCFTALFALPTIRALLPGAPSYGAIIDLVGILPCTLIVALCAVCVSVAKLNMRDKSRKEE